LILKLNFASRLQLALGHASEKIEYFAKFEKVINSIYSFYHSRSHKRRGHLEELAEELDQKFYTLNYIYKVRWIISELSAIKKIKNIWYLLIEDLNSIKNDKKFDANSRRLADKYHQILCDRNFVSILYLILDLLEILNHYSVIFQQKGGLLIDKWFVRNQMLNSIRRFNDRDGAMLTSLLSGVKCDEFETCTLEIYEKSDTNVTFNNIILTFSDEIPTVSSFKTTLIQELENNLKSYFPEVEFESFKVFLPNHLPRDPLQFSSYGQNEIESIGRFFDFDIDTLSRDWQTFLEKLHSNPRLFCDIENLPPYKFWPRVLREVEDLPLIFKKLMRIVLALPIG